MCQFISVRSLLISSLFYSVPSPHYTMRHNYPHLCNQKLRVSNKLPLIPLLLVTRKPLYFFYSHFSQFLPALFFKRITETLGYQITKSQAKFKILMGSLTCISLPRKNSIISEQSCTVPTSTPQFERREC